MTFSEWMTRSGLRKVARRWRRVHDMIALHYDRDVRRDAVRRAPATTLGLQEE